MNELNRGQSCLETYGLFSNLTFFFFQAEDGIRDHCVTGVQTCALPISAEHVEVCVPEKTAGILPKRPEPAPCQKKALRSRVAGAFLLLVLLTSRGSTGDPAAAADHGPGPASTALAVSVSETPDAVLLHIRAPGD